MRQIKFRAWDKRHKIMSRVGPFDILEPRALIAEIKNGGWPVSMCDIILLQFTGLLDKNGKEIYEGDIVEISHNKYVCKYIIKPWAGAFRFCVLPHEKWWDGSDAPREVIGNVHENPELIKDTK